MKRVRTLTCLLAFAAILSAFDAPVLAQQPATATAAAPAAAPTPAQPTPAQPAAQPAPAQPAAQPASIPLTPLPLSPLTKTIETLVGVPSSQPSPATAAAPADEDAVGQIGYNFANDIFDTLSRAVEGLKADGANFIANFSALPDLGDWIGRQSSDPRRQALWNEIGSDLLVVVGIPALAGIALLLLLLPLRFKLRANRPESLASRIGVLLGLFALRMIPVVFFLGASLLLLDQNETHKLARYVIINIIYAIALTCVIRQILRAVFAPATDHLRLLSFTTREAVYACRWFSAFSLMIVFGCFTTLIASAVHVPGSAVFMFQNVLGLILMIMAITVIVQTRVRVALIIRGKKTETDESFAHALRQWLAYHWHILAIAYLVISFLVTALGIDNGVVRMLRGTILTFTALAVTRLSFVALDRWVAPQAGSPALMHRQLLSFILRPFIWVVVCIAIAASWGMHIRRFIATPPGERAFSAFLSIALTLFFLTVIYEILNSSIERQLNRRDKTGNMPAASARTRTLLPMVRNSIFILFSGVGVLTLLSAVGFNIGPLLAGAGVVGVAIGFGSQSLVKDFLTGLFIVIENTIAVGDVVKIGDFGGVVETMSIRTLRLRDNDGSLHIIPFSVVNQITNMTRGFAYALVNVAVVYDSDLERVMAVLRDIGKGVQEDPIFKRVILEPIEVLGVDKMGDAAITIQARIRTRPGKQWDVRRLLLLRIQQRFEKENIGIPTTVTNTQFAKAKAAATPAPTPEEKPVKATTGPAEPGT